ncbi:4'-phosphopantetheinyl transferase family protein [Flavobacterium cerinum]|uniref:4-phosphopantetheinyl transferase family protein n=1 Tax=Flavobacterium cerinum TaxID=2502784 RepID=A0A3S4T1G3_9FLAO|nr:4'-phosphopantetheinyl transferase superfamily protein [Flavobacterium cerinum]RWX00393.1 4-phosphopantetheinyl transferase family protein [Flavobacterium cerinum]
MIGNDVIDLEATRVQSNWKRPGLLEKLFTQEEREVINSHNSPEIMVWVLWSMKEAAYKIYNRQTKLRSFIPLQLICTIDVSCSTVIRGVVKCNGFIYATKTVLDGNLIHTIATVNIIDIEKIEEPENSNVIKDTSGIPYQLIENEMYPVSISHHGRFYKIVSLKYC